MQYEQYEDGTRTDLPRPSIDTGMGLERIGAVLQGVHDNYDTDLMRALIEASANATDGAPDGPGRIHHRVIADHLRSTSFLIADGVLPSNEGRGYVLRRIMRRAMRHAHLLGAEDPVIYRLVPALVGQMGAAFPELTRAKALIEETLRSEETRFQATLDRGLRILDEEVGRLPEGAPLPGDAAFRLYDTYGFPLDLTQDALREQSRTVDVAGFEAAMAEQKAKARAAWAGSGEAADETVWLDLADRLGPTEFLGYDTETAEGQIVALVVGGHPVEAAEIGTEVADRPQPDARSTPNPAARSATPARCAPTRPASRSPTSARRPASSSTTAASPKAASPAAPRPSSPSTTTAAPPSAPTTRPPTSSTRPCAAPSATTSPSAAASSPPTACASTSPTPRR